VFASKHGGPLEAQNVVNRHFKPLLKRAGLPPSASTTCGIAASRSLLSAASPSATYKPSPGMQRRHSRSRDTPITTTLRRGAWPTLWATSYPTSPKARRWCQSGVKSPR
jgi:hypothetical protein